MRRWLVRTLGLPGSWTWACRQMRAGRCVRPASASGAVRYRLDVEGQERIEWSFGDDRWANANVFLSDFATTDWTTRERRGRNEPTAATDTRAHRAGVVAGKAVTWAGLTVAAVSIAAGVAWVTWTLVKGLALGSAWGGW